MEPICSICASIRLRTPSPCPTHHSSSEDIYQNPDQDTFLYDELQSEHSIRLIQIEDGSGHDAMRIRLSLTSTEATSEQPLYQALSYVWGTSSATKTIFCDNVPLDIGQNLFQALWRIREDGDTDLPWWVDAVSINQKNTLEKNTQVRKMKEIYANASLVLAWIGQEEEGDAAGFKLIRTIYGQLGDHADEMSRGDLTRQHDTLRQLALPPMEDPRWTAMVRILYREYFERVWIIQETLVAQQCVFKSGTQSIGRREIFAIGAWYEFFQSIRDAIQTQLPAITECRKEELEDLHYQTFNIRDLWLFSAGIDLGGESSNAGIPIIRLLSRTTGFKATKDIDKIFALVGLSSDASPLIIDYGKSINDVQLQIAKISLEQNESWGPLLFSYVNSAGRSSDLPSWVPDWVKAPSKYASIAGHNCYTPNHTKSVFWSINLKNEILLSASILDVLESIVHKQPCNTGRPKLHEPAIALRSAVQMSDWICDCHDLVPQSQKYFTGESAFDAFWRTLVCNRETGNAAPDDLATSYLSFTHTFMFMIALHEIKLAAVNRLHPNHKPHPQTLWVRAWEYLRLRLGLIRDYIGIFICKICLRLAANHSQRFERAFLQYAVGRKFFRSKIGYIGWVPEATREGDLLCVFQHCSLPFVVRRDGSGYRIVGEAYIHGVMDMLPNEVLELSFDTLKIV